MCVCVAGVVAAIVKIGAVVLAAGAVFFWHSKGNRYC